MSEPRRPNLVIAGVGKAGTTSLFWYLSQHPDICASGVKEPRYFRPPGDGDLPPLEGYLRHFAHCGPQRYVLEASPQYFKGGARTIDAIRRTLPDPRLMLMFRNPVDRLWSEYRFKKSRMTLPADISFDGFVAECERVRDGGLPLSSETSPYWTLAGGTYADHVTPWLDAFGDALRVGFFEHMAADPPGFVAGVCRWLGVDDVVAGAFNYSVENRSMSYRSRALQRLALAVNEEGRLRNRRRLKVPLRGLYRALNKGVDQERMSPQARLRLESLFAPSNALLAEALQRRGYADLPGWLP
ncbi:MAG: sulfotransferase domain-containing protein [Actinobacteria bacterium]|nr:sulfotransferase domain-containing protein [Actinomycetota bacterium]